MAARQWRVLPVQPPSIIDLGDKISSPSIPRPKHVASIQFGSETIRSSCSHQIRSTSIMTNLEAEIQHEALLPRALLPSQMTQEARNGSSEPGNEIVRLEIPAEYHEKRRPWSSQGFKSVLSPSPLFIDSRRTSKDDLSVASDPVTPKRPNVPPRCLSLQMPPRDISSTSTANLTKRIPVSPKPETAATYPSPSSVLPRRSRGMDFSRAATNLHHSTLAESSPESSPIVGSRGSLMPRKGLFSPPSNPSVPESPNSAPNSSWSTTTNPEKLGLSSSVGSSSVMDYDSGSTSSDADEVMDNGEDDDTIHMTPHANQFGNGFGNPFGSVASSPGGDGIGTFSPAASKLMSYQRHRVKSRRKRMSSSSASGRSSLYSPGPSSPPLLRSIESSLSITGGFFLDEPSKKEMNSRRESLSLGTSDMQLSDAEQSDGEGFLRMHSHEGVPIPTPVTPTMDDRRNVIRKAVTRRGNMLVCLNSVMNTTSPSGDHVRRMLIQSLAENQGLYTHPSCASRRRGTHRQ